MDVVAACSAFVHVSEKGNLTRGAAAARVSPHMARCRIAALEWYLGARLFAHPARQAVPTPFGHAILPSARRLIWLIEAMEEYVASTRKGPFRVAVPDTCSRLGLARLIAEARLNDVPLDPRPASRQARTDLLCSRKVEAAFVTVPPSEATWRIPLGLAGASPLGTGRRNTETLRPARTGGNQRARRVWIQPEDDVPHIRDRMTRIKDAVGPCPAQVTVAHSLTAAVTATLRSDDLLVASVAQVAELGMHWSPLGEATLVRGLDVVTAAGENPELLRIVLRGSVARCVGASDSEEAWPKWAGSRVTP